MDHAVYSYMTGRYKFGVTDPTHDTLNDEALEEKHYERAPKIFHFPLIISNTPKLTNGNSEENNV